MKNKNKSVLYISKDALIDLFKGYLHKYKDNSHLNVRVENDQLLQLEIWVATEGKPALVNAFATKENGYTLSYKLGSNQQLGHDVVTGVYKLYGLSYNEHAAPSAIKLRPDQADAIFSELENGPWVNIEHLDDQARKVRYTNAEGERLVVSFWPTTGSFFPQTGSPSLTILINDLTAKHLDYSSSREVSEKASAVETANEVLFTRYDTMVEYLGENLLCFIAKKNKGLLDACQQAFQDYIDKRTYPSIDYAPIVHEIGKCLESLLKTLFTESGMPYYKQLDKYYNKNTVTNKFYLKDELAPPKMSINELYELGRLFRLFSSRRNPSSHGDDRAHHKNIRTYEDTKKQFQELVDGAKESYSLMKPYLINWP